MPVRREATGCPKAMTRQSYYESRISAIPDVFLPSPSIWALSRSIQATTSFDAAVAAPGEIYSRAMNSLPHRNWRSVDAFSETRQTEWFLSARATRHSELGSTADNCSHTDRRRGSRIARREASSAG